MDRMQTEAIIIPTFQRPELLALCIERIRSINADIPIKVFEDDRKHGTYGNSRNVLEALKWAYQQNYEVIYLIEDDVLIHEDFFAYHREALATHEVSCGWKFTDEMQPAETIYPIQSLPFYFSIGNAFKREFIHRVLAHAKPDYYQHQRDYCIKEFPRSSVGMGNFEQDGLILRVMEKARIKAAWASRPVCTHTGDWFDNIKPKSIEHARQIIRANDPNSPRSLEDVAVLVKTFLRPGYLNATLKSIEEHMNEASVVIVDDSDVHTFNGADFDLDLLYMKMPFDSGFGAKANHAIPALKQSRYALIASDDFEFTPKVREGVIKMAKLLDLRPDIAVASGRVADNPYEGWLSNKDGIITETLLTNEPWLKLAGVEYRLCDLTVNFSLIRTEVLGAVKWAEPYKIGGEHYEFFADLKRLGWLTAIVKGVSINDWGHHPEWEDARYSDFRGRARASWPLFAERNQCFAYVGFGGTTILPDVGQQPAAAPKVLVGIASCEAYKERWKYIDKAHDKFIFTGKVLGVPDDYEHLPHKVQAMCRWALKYNYDFMFKADDDTYIVWDRLLRSGFEQYHYTGRYNSAEHGWASGGSGYWLSKTAMEAICEARIEDWAEDRFVGSTLRQRGIVCKHDPRYTLLPDETVAQKDFITACVIDGNIRGGFALARHLAGVR